VPLLDTMIPPAIPHALTNNCKNSSALIVAPPGADCATFLTRTNPYVSTLAILVSLVLILSVLKVPHRTEIHKICESNTATLHLVMYPFQKLDNVNLAGAAGVPCALSRGSEPSHAAPWLSRCSLSTYSILSNAFFALTSTRLCCVSMRKPEV
jgi:hypothetical protein